MISILFLALLPTFLSGNPGKVAVETVTMESAFRTMTFAVFFVCGVFAALAGRLALERA